MFGLGLFCFSAFSTYMVVKNFFTITSFMINLISLPPGTGKVFSKTNPKSKRKEVFVKTDLGTVRLPYIRLPSVDTDFYFFEKEDVVNENKIITREEFDSDYKHYQIFQPKRYLMGIVMEYFYPHEYKNRKKLCGYINSIMEDYVYIFYFEDEFIDYEKLFDEYHDKLNSYVPEEKGEII
jgi:hypothetical protein